MGFREDLEDRILVLDGAMGTRLISMGVRIDTIADVLNIENPEPVKEVITSYLSAGADIIRTNTFNTIRPKLANFGLENRLGDIARAAVNLTRSIIGDRAYLAVSIGPTGEVLYPFGSATFDEIYEYYYEIGRIYEDEGVDIFWLETFSDLYELKTAIIAIRDVSKRPLVALMTFDENMRSTFGTTPQIMAVTISGFDVDAIGANCSIGTSGILNVIAEMRDFTDLPLVAQPNAGIPKKVNEQITYPERPEEMSSYTKRFIENGVRIVGACCGSTEFHIREIKREVLSIPAVQPLKRRVLNLYLTSRSNLVEIGLNRQPVIIGERLNPTNKRNLSEGILKRDYQEFIKEAKAQLESGAEVLDVNAGVAGVNEAESLPEIIRAVIKEKDVPFSIDTSNDEALTKAIKIISGRGLINSVRLDNSLQNRLSLAKRFGAAVIALTMDEKGIPESASERIKIAEKILSEALKYGISERDILFDFLTLSVATSPDQMNETIRSIEEFRKRGLFTVLGVSNISYGLPARSYINSAFLTLAIRAGLSAAIIDPTDKNVFSSLIAASALCGYDRNFSRYIELSTRLKKGAGSESSEYVSPLLKLSNSIIAGERTKSLEYTKALLDKGVDYKRIISEGILKAMKEVGLRFKANLIFLPQVMLSAEAAQLSFDEIMKRVGKSADLEKKGKIIIATVAGDVHDLGKNLVAAVLRNSGFDVIDLGKNVKSDVIVEAAKTNGADIVALSALMTTTMGHMKEVVELLKENRIDIPVMIGGAVVSESYAREIGAYYGQDAIEAVSIAESIIRNWEK
jgi:5-methyltetrahydrofolate--homocysteine methyltransferase